MATKKSRKTNRNLVKIKDKAFDPRPLKLLLTVFAIILMTVYYQTARASTANNSQGFAELEKQVWLSDSQQFSNLETRIVRWIQESPQANEPHYLLSHLYIRKYADSPSDLELLKKASELAQQAIDLNGKSELGYIALAQVLDIMGRTPNAIKLIDPDYNPGVNYSWRRWLLETKFKSDRLDDKALLKNLELALKDPFAQNEIISPYVIAILQSTFQSAALLSELRQWNSKYPSLPFVEAQALTLAKLGRFSEAHKLYAQSYAASKDRIEPLLNDAIILYRELNQFDEANKILEHIVTNLAKGIPRHYLALAHTHSGTIYLSKSQNTLAEKSYEKALNAADNKFEILNLITETYRSKKKHRQLAAFIKKANNIMAGSGVLHALLGETLSEDLGDHQAALHSFSNAIALEPDRADYYNGMGLTYYRLKNLDKALLVFNQASKIDPDDAISRYNVACVLSRLNRASEALLSLKEAISLDPRLIETAKLDEDFKNLHNQTQFVELMSPLAGKDRHSLAH